MRKFLQVAVVVVLAVSWCKAAGTQKAGSASLVLYDNFDATLINPAKWVGTYDDPGILETVRQIVAVPGVPKDKELHLMQRSYGVTTDDNGATGGLSGLSFPNPSAITAISFTLVANTIKVVGCKTNPGGETVAGPEFRGVFFNVDASPTGYDHDVTAAIGITQGLQGGPSVVALVEEGNGTVLGYQILGTVALKSINTLFLQWDQPNHQFIFQLNSLPQVFEPYNVSDTSQPFGPGKNIDLARVLPDCTSTPRPYALVD